MYSRAQSHEDLPHNNNNTSECSLLSPSFPWLIKSVLDTIGLVLRVISTNLLRAAASRVWTLVSVDTQRRLAPRVLVSR